MVDYEMLLSELTKISENLLVGFETCNLWWTI